MDSIRNKSHWNYENIIAKDPLRLGFCNEKDLNKMSELHKVEKTIEENDQISDNSNENNETEEINKEQ